MLQQNFHVRGPLNGSATCRTAPPPRTIAAVLDFAFTAWSFMALRKLFFSSHTCCWPVCAINEQDEAASLTSTVCSAGLAAGASTK